MYEDEFVNTIEAGKQYKLGVLYEFLSKYNYHLYSTTIDFSIGNEQRICNVNKVISKDYYCLSDSNNSGRIDSQKVNGLIFAEY